MATEISKSKRDNSRKESGGMPENLKELEQAYLPDACVYENEDDLILLLDVPGVEKGQVRIEVDEQRSGYPLRVGMSVETYVNVK